MPKTKSINLLPQEEFEASSVGRVLRWAMGTFRFIVIITEMIVMAAFLSRFWLDAENSNLSDSIKIASAQIQVQADFEKEFRNLQTKLGIYKQINSASVASQKLLALAQKTPPDILLTTVTVKDGSGEIKGVATTETSIAQFISNLKSEPAFKKVALGGVDTKDEQESQITFQINITY